jgi:hypothetical protein
MFGDEHPDTVLALCGLAEMLRLSAKIFSSSSSEEERKGSVSVAKGMVPSPSLGSHLSSALSLPSHGLKQHWPPSATIQALHGRDEPSKVLRAKTVAPKKKPFNATGGFMGYVFPAAKKLTNTNVRSVTQPTKIHTDDCKWLLGYAMSLSKKLFGEFSGGIHPVNAALLFQKGWLAIPI